MTETTTGHGVQARVLDAAHQLGRALAESPAYEAFEAADQRVRDDADAQQALQAMREAQQRLGWRARAGALTEDERNELMALNAEVRRQPAIQAIQSAQSTLMAEARAAADIITDAAGVDFASTCGPGGC